MKKLLIIAMATSTLVLAACNTVQGAGRDVQSVGDCVDGRPNNC
jgi:entericidin A